MNFESPDVEKEFPGLYASQGLEHDLSDEESERATKKRDSKSREKKRDRKDKGYRMFEEEDSEEELVIDDTRSPSKMKKHSKPSFKFTKKDKFYKPKDKEKDVQKEKEKEEKKKEDKEAKKLKFKKKKHEGSKTDISDGAKVKEVKPAFGVPLAAAVERSRCHDGVQLPAVFRECIDYIEEFGLSCEGIYRVSGVKSKVQALKDAYNRGTPVYLHEHEPPIIASLLKQFLRDLPEPVLTTELMPRFEQASTVKNVKQKVEQFQQLIEQLPMPNRLLLSWMIVHMTHVIAKESHNKMSLQNVSIVVSPTMRISHRVLNVFFTYSKILFRDTVIKRYVPPLRPVSSRWSLELPESPSAIEEELHKQESLLNQLHEDVRKVKNAAEKEEQLWEVQRVVTQLKRKLKHVRKAQEAAKAAEKREAELVQEKLQIQQEHEKQKEEEQQAQQQEAQPGQEPQKVEPESTEPAEEQAEVQVEDQPAESPAAAAATASAEEVQVQPQVPAVPQETAQAQPLPQQQPHSQQPLQQQSLPQQPLPQQSLQQQPLPQQPLPHQPVSQQPQPQHPLPQHILPQQPVVLQDQQQVYQPQEVPQAPPAAVATTAVVHPVEVVSEVAVHVVPLPQQTTQTNVQQHPSPPEVVPQPAHEAVPQKMTVPAPHQLPPNHLSPMPAAIPKLQSPLQPQRLHVEQDQKPSTIQEEPVTFEVGGEKFHRESSVNEESWDSDERTVTRSLSDLSIEDRQEKVQITTIEIVDRKGLPTVETTEEAVIDNVDKSDAESSSSSVVSSPDEETDNEEMQELLLEETSLTLEEEELRAIGDELRQKIETERSEIERLHQEIAELQEIRDDLYEEDDSDSDSSSSSEDEDELQDTLRALIKENKELEVQNSDLCDKVHLERQICLEVKVQIRLIQLRQAETAGPAHVERELMIF